MSIIDVHCDMVNRAVRACEQWDGCSTAELVLSIIAATGEDVGEVLADANHKAGRPLQLQSFVETPKPSVTVIEDDGGDGDEWWADVDPADLPRW